MVRVPDDKHLGRVGRDELIGLIRQLEKERDELAAALASTPIGTTHPPIIPGMHHPLECECELCS